MNVNLISYGKLTDKNTIISKGNLVKTNDENNKVIAVAVKENKNLQNEKYIEIRTGFCK